MHGNKKEPASKFQFVPVASGNSAFVANAMLRIVRQYDLCADHDVEYTLAIIKPDGMEKGIQDDVIKIFRDNGIEVVRMNRLIASREDIADHLNYRADFQEVLGDKIKRLCQTRGFEEKLPDKNDATIVGGIFKGFVVDYMASGEIMPMILKGHDAIAKTKALCGSTFPADADKNTIRGRYGIDSFRDTMTEMRAPRNIIHAAENKAEADHQISVWFPDFKVIHVQPV